MNAMRPILAPTLRPILRGSLIVGIGVVIAHRPSVLAAADLVAVVTAGQLKAFGPKDEVLRKVLRNPVQTNGATPTLSVAMATDA